MRGRRKFASGTEMRETVSTATRWVLIGQFQSVADSKYVINVGIGAWRQKKQLLTAFVGCRSRASKKPINGEMGAPAVRLELSQGK